VLGMSSVLDGEAQTEEEQAEEISGGGEEPGGGVVGGGGAARRCLWREGSRFEPLVCRMKQSARHALLKGGVLRSRA